MGIKYDNNVGPMIVDDTTGKVLGYQDVRGVNRYMDGRVMPSTEDGSGAVVGGGSRTWSGDASGTVTIDPTLYDTYHIRATGNITVAMGVGGIEAVRRVAVNIATNGGSFTVTWPVSILWDAGEPPSVAPTQSQPVRVVLTADAGEARWKGSIPLATTQNTVVFDSFAGAASTNLNGRTPTSGTANTWVDSTANTWMLDGNGFVTPNTWTDGQYARLNIGRTQYSVTCSMTGSHLDINNRATPGFGVCFTNNTNHVYAELDTANKAVFVYEFVSGTPRLVTTIAMDSLVSGSSVKIRWDVDGQKLTLHVNDVEKCHYVTEVASTSTIFFRSGKSNSPTTKPTWGPITVTYYQGLSLNWPVFVKAQQTPVLPVGAPGAWDSEDANNPTPFYDPINGRWVLNYSGYKTGDGGVQHFGLAYASTLGASSWTKDPANPIISADGTDGFYAFNGGVVFWRGKFWALQVSSNGTALRLRTSRDTRTWTDLGIVISATLPSSASWKANGCFDSFLRVTQDDRLEAWYCGSQATVRSFGRAWIDESGRVTEDTRNPVCRPPIDVFGQVYVGEPSVYVPQGQEGKQILISFDGNAMRDSVQCQRRVCQAASLDGGISWRFRVAASKPGGGGSWESLQNFDSHIERDGNTLRLFYGGADTVGGSLDLNIQLGRSDAVWTVDSLV